MADNSIRSDVAWEEAVEVIADLAEQTGHFLEKEILLGFIGRSRAKFEKSPNYSGTYADPGFPIPRNHIIADSNYLVNNLTLLPEPSDEVLRLLLVENKKISAIKQYRGDTNIGLRGSKYLMDWYQADYKHRPNKYAHLFENQVLE